MLFCVLAGGLDSCESFCLPRPSKSGWQIGRQQPEPVPEAADSDLPDGSVGMKRIVHNVVDQALLQTAKREVKWELAFDGKFFWLFVPQTS